MFVWIHRLNDPDLRVTFEDFQEARYFGKLVLMVTCEKPILSTLCSDTVFYRDHRVAIGESSNMQVLIQRDDHTPEEGWDYWCPLGIEDVTDERALAILQGMEKVTS